MAKKKYVPKKSQLTVELQRRREETQRWAEANRENIIARSRTLRTAADARRVTLPETFALLKAERERQGLTLADLEAKTGINKPALSRLENADEVNSTVSTLCRVAEALGKTIHVVLTDR